MERRESEIFLEEFLRTGQVLSPFFCNWQCHRRKLLAVNTGLRGPPCSGGGGLVHSWCGSRCPAPLQAQEQSRRGSGRQGSHGDSVLPQGKWVSCELCHSTRTHMYTCTGEPWSRVLEDRDVVVDLGPVALGDALGNPHDVATLLLLELHKGVENTNRDQDHPSPRKRNAKKQNGSLRRPYR